MTKIAIITVLQDKMVHIYRTSDSKGYIIYGIIRRNSNINTERINIYTNMNQITYTKYGDLTDISCRNKHF